VSRVSLVLTSTLSSILEGMKPLLTQGHYVAFAETYFDTWAIVFRFSSNGGQAQSLSVQALLLSPAIQGTVSLRAHILSQLGSILI